MEVQSHRINQLLGVVVALIAEGMAVGVGLGVGVDLGVEVDDLC
jgi:hypothetical protein